MMEIDGAAQAQIEASITDADYLKFSDFFYRKTGIRFDEKRKYFVLKRLARRILETGCDGFRAYFTKMRFEAAQTEFQQLTNAMTVNETYFFREEYQLKALVGPILDEIVSRSNGAGPLRIWSMPCATGEEPYSIALMLLESWPPIDRVDVQLLASDIDTRALAAAEAGRYSARSVQYVPKDQLRRHFKKVSEHEYEISEDVRDCVERSHLNLQDPEIVRKVAPIDVIFCRNLLIYFDDTSRRQAAESFFEILKPGGFILLGHSESMSRMSSLFKVRKFQDCIVYQKPLS
ncbi:MAG: protein-glutamate O-methyltransferase CheR [Pseudomonadota bacterium]